MILRRITEHVRARNWFALVLDFLFVVFGIFFGFQVTEWNEVRVDRLQEQSYHEHLYAELSLSIERIEWNAAFMNHHADYGSLILQAPRISPAIATIEDRVMFLQSQPSSPVKNITSDGVRYNFAELCLDSSFQNTISAVRASTFNTVYFVQEVIAQQRGVLATIESELGIRSPNAF